MVLIPNKRGIFFTLIAISLMSLLLISVSIYSLAQDRENVGNRIETMNNYVFSFEKDLTRKLYISGFRIIFLYEKRMLETGNYIVDVDATFSEAFLNGTIEGVVNNDELLLLEGVTFSNISRDLNNDAAKVNIKINLTNPVILISQEDPWNIKIDLTVDLLIEDIGGLAYWNRTANFEAYIPITNFEDPLYLIETNGFIAHKINITPYNSTEFVDGSDVTKLTDHLNNFYYIDNTDAPSFLKRLEGDFSSDPNGIESLVNIQALSSAGIGVVDKVIVDHIYFSSANPSGSTYSGMPSWFKLDSGHEGTYGL
ncbi:MAG: hypothetical protein IH845_02210 [Nanoarchaeota archaeon]|nr:hypothetical protein [Nanoarchaeota archaeon]